MRNGVSKFPHYVCGRHEVWGVPTRRALDWLLAHHSSV